MAGAQRAFLRIRGSSSALSAVLLGGANVDEWVAEVGEHVVLEGANGGVVALDHRVVHRGGRLGIRCIGATIGFPLGASAIEQANILVAEEGEDPEGVGGPPVVLVAVDDDSRVAADALGAEERGEASAVDVVALDRVVEVGVPVDLHGASNVTGLVEQHVFVRLNDYEARRTEMRFEPVAADEAFRVGVAGKFG